MPLRFCIQIQLDNPPSNQERLQVRLRFAQHFFLGIAFHNNGRPLADACAVSVRPNLDVILSNETVASAELIMTGEPGRERLLDRRMRGIRSYDFILLDCPPSLSLLSQNALT
jgi:cellulose biosynthesis protein BcsQ